MGMPGRLWKTALTMVSNGSGYAPFTFTCVLADHGGLISQNPGRVLYVVSDPFLPIGESIAKQLAVPVWPALNPPPTNAPPFSPPSNVRSTPLSTSAPLPNLPDSGTR